MPIFTIAIIPLILILVEITRQDDPSMKTAVYADVVTAAVKITLQNGKIHYISSIPNFATILNVENHGLLL